MPIEKLPHHITIFHPPSGAKASIAYIGATVFSWNVGSSDNGEKLWKSSKWVDVPFLCLFLVADRRRIEGQKCGLQRGDVTDRTLHALE